MGYVINLIDQDFRIPVENEQDALEDLYEFMEEHGHDPRDKAFAWLNGVDHTEWRSLGQALDDWRFIPISDYSDAEPPYGDQPITTLRFRGEKLGDEKEMFDVIAPYVETGSYLMFRGEDGHMWRYVFHEESVEEVNADQ